MLFPRFPPWLAGMLRRLVGLAWRLAGGFSWNGWSRLGEEEAPIRLDFRKCCRIVEKCLAESQEAISNHLSIKLSGQNAQVVEMLLLLAREFADEAIERIDQVHAQRAKISEKPAAFFPLRGQIVRLDVAKPKPVVVTDALDERALGADFLRYLIDEIDGVGGARCQLMYERCDGPSHVDIGGLVNALAQKSKDLLDLLLVNAGHEPSPDRVKAGLSEFLLKDLTNGECCWSRGEPLVKAARSPETPERAHRIANEKPGSEIRSLAAGKVRLDRSGQPISIDVRLAPDEFPGIVRSKKGVFLFVSPASPASDTPLTLRSCLFFPKGPSWRLSAGGIARQAFAGRVSTNAAQPASFRRDWAASHSASSWGQEQLAQRLQVASQDTQTYIAVEAKLRLVTSTLQAVAGLQGADSIPG